MRRRSRCTPRCPRLSKPQARWPLQGRKSTRQRTGAQAQDGRGKHLSAYDVFSFGLARTPQSPLPGRRLPRQRSRSQQCRRLISLRFEDRARGSALRTGSQRALNANQGSKPPTWMPTRHNNGAGRRPSRRERLSLRRGPPGSGARPSPLHAAHRRSRPRFRRRGRSAVRLSSVTPWLATQDQPLPCAFEHLGSYPSGRVKERTGALHRDS
jgi:hypothetical protein